VGFSFKSVKKCCGWEIYRVISFLSFDEFFLMYVRETMQHIKNVFTFTFLNSFSFFRNGLFLHDTYT
jgi:hypothetical protein